MNPLRDLLAPIIFLNENSCAAAADTARTFFERLTQVCQPDARVKPLPPSPDAGGTTP